MKIQRYRMQDIPKMLNHIRTFLQETENYKDMSFNKDKIASLLINNVNNTKFFCNLAFEEDEIIGGLCASVYSYPFSDEIFAADLLFYIPKDRRGLSTATDLVVSYVEWAKLRGVKECRLANSTGIKPEAYVKLCERFGFSYLGPIYQMRF